MEHASLEATSLKWNVELTSVSSQDPAQDLGWSFWVICWGEGANPKQQNQDTERKAKLTSRTLVGGAALNQQWQDTVVSEAYLQCEP